MKISAPCTVLLFALFPFVTTAAEKPSAKDEIKALVLEDAKKAAKSPSAAATKPADKDAKLAAAKSDQIPAAPAATPTPLPPKGDPAKPTEPAVKLPQVEVNKNRVTQLDHDLYEQDRKMAFEAKNTKATEVDRALNSSAVNPSILGGYSAKVRTGIAQERLELMEFEKDLIEAIARAKTKEEKADLKKQLDDIRAMRRMIDSTPEQKGRDGR